MKTPIIIISTILLASCGDGKQKEKIENTVVSVQVSIVKENNIGSFVSASGKIESENSANISTRTMGYVSKMNVKVGDKVRRGQLLAHINNADLQAKSAQANAVVLQAKAALHNAKKEYDRFVNLFGQQSATQKELDDVTARFEMAKAQLEGAEQMQNEVLAQFLYTNLTAPFSGIVTNIFVKEGDMATPGMPLVSIEGNAEMQVTAMVSENDISNIKNGMPAQVLVKSLNKEITGKVSEVSLSAKNTGGQYLVKITLDASEEILSGMFVNVQFPIDNATFQSNRILIPEKALVRQGQLTGIYTVGNNNIAILRWLRTGKTFGNQIEILSGLSANEAYIISAGGKLYNGAKVSIQ